MLFKDLRPGDRFIYPDFDPTCAAVLVKIERPLVNELSDGPPITAIVVRSGAIYAVPDDRVVIHVD